MRKGFRINKGPAGIRMIRSAIKQWNRGVEEVPEKGKDGTWKRNILIERSGR